MEELTPISPPSYLDWFNLESRPLLRLAAQNARPAFSVKVEWFVDRMKDGLVESAVWSNYTQILRQPFQREWLPEEQRRQTFAEAAQEAGEKILDAAELTLWHGTPRFHVSGQFPTSTCGGIRHYLRRRVYENDAVALLELRPLVLLRDRGEHDEFRAEKDRIHEWLWEFSLEVIPGPYQRGMAPIALPPKETH